MSAHLKNRGRNSTKCDKDECFKGTFEYERPDRKSYYTGKNKVMKEANGSASRSRGMGDSNETSYTNRETNRGTLRSPSLELDGTIHRQVRKCKSVDQFDLINKNHTNRTNETECLPETGCTSHETVHCTVKNGAFPKAPRRRNSRMTNILESSTDNAPEKSKLLNTEDSPTEKLPNFKNGQKISIQGPRRNSFELTSNGAVTSLIIKSQFEEQDDLRRVLGQAKIIEIPSQASYPSNKREHCPVKSNQHAKAFQGTNPKGEEDITSNSGVIKCNRYENPKPFKSLKDVLESLKLKMADISQAAGKVNKVIDAIFKSDITKSHPLFKSMEKMSAGSYYENVKISKPNEFDIMLKIKFDSFHTIEMTSIDGSAAFYTLSFKRRKPQVMAQYTDDDNIILAKCILDDFRKLINDVIDKSDAYLQKKAPSSPAVTLLIPHEPEPLSVDLVLALEMRRWPEEANSEHTRKYKKQPCYMVPKKPKLAKKDIIDTWRVSFSNIEKEIMNNHGSNRSCCNREKGTMCCRKPCLKLMKHLLELLKKNGIPIKMNQFCSYHAKTAILHLFSEYPEDEDWSLKRLDYCFNRYVEYFQTCLSSRHLPNFFIPSQNLFSSNSVHETSCDYLWGELEYQKSSKYPIFYAGQGGSANNPHAIPSLHLEE